MPQFTTEEAIVTGNEMFPMMDNRNQEFIKTEEFPTPGSITTAAAASAKSLMEGITGNTMFFLNKRWN